MISRGGSGAVVLNDLLRVCPVEKGFPETTEALLFLSLIASDQLKPSPSSRVLVTCTQFRQTNARDATRIQE